jgi:hypothetical protein
MSFSPLQTPGERPQQRLPISESGSEDFIEIHHLMPISELRGLMVRATPERDYAALRPRGARHHRQQCSARSDGYRHESDRRRSRAEQPLHKALERYGHVDEIVSFVVYLASPEASLITGASLLADGGYSAQKFSG